MKRGTIYNITSGLTCEFAQVIGLATLYAHFIEETYTNTTTEKKQWEIGFSHSSSRKLRKLVAMIFANVN